MGKKRVDYVLLFLVLLLAMFGLFMLYSTSAYNGRVKFADSFYYLKKQFFATSVGLLPMYLVSCMDYRNLKNLAVPGYVLSLFLSAMVLLVGAPTMVPGVGCHLDRCLFSRPNMPSLQSWCCLHLSLAMSGTG